MNYEINLSANELFDKLNLELPARWEVYANEIDVVCIDSPDFELGFIVTLQFDSCKGYSFKVTEIAASKETGHFHNEESTHLTLNDALQVIRARVDVYKENN